MYVGHALHIVKQEASKGVVHQAVHSEVTSQGILTPSSSPGQLGRRLLLLLLAVMV